MLTRLQARAARLMASNRTEGSYFAGGAVLNQHTKRLSDDLDVFNDSEDVIDALYPKDIQVLEGDGLEVSVNLDIWGCVEAGVRDELRRETIIQWMGETRMRFFPLVKDPLWGLRLHRSDLAVNKVIAASSRMQARDTADLVLISHHFCPLGPLFLAASVKLGRTSPLELVDRARHRTATTSNEDLEELRVVTDCENAGGVKVAAFIALDLAEVFLRDLPDVMVGGLPANDDGVPVERAEDMACLRPVLDGGGRFPDFTDAPPAFSDIGSQDDRP